MFWYPSWAATCSAVLFSTMIFTCQSNHVAGQQQLRLMTRASAWFWLGGPMPPCRLRRSKFWKFDPICPYVRTPMANDTLTGFWYQLDGTILELIPETNKCQCVVHDVARYQSFNWLHGHVSDFTASSTVWLTTTGSLISLSWEIHKARVDYWCKPRNMEKSDTSVI